MEGIFLLLLAVFCLSGVLTGLFAYSHKEHYEEPDGDIFKDTF